MNTAEHTLRDNGPLGSTTVNILDLNADGAEVKPLEKGIQGGLKVEADVILSRIKQFLQIPTPTLELDRKDVLIHATGGPAKKASMLLEQEQKYDATVAEHRTEASFLSKVVKDLQKGFDQEESRLGWTIRHTAAEVEVKRPVLRYGWESIGMLVFSLALIGVGINTTATILMGSGIKGLDDPVRAYLFSFVPAALALGLKGIYRLLSEPYQTMYARAVWVLGLIHGGVWVILFSRIFSGFAQSADAVLKNLLATGGVVATDSGLESAALIGCGILAEIFLAAGCFISAQRSCDVVELGIKKKNPEYYRLATQRDELSHKSGELKNAAARLEARLEQIAAARKAFLNKAGVFFELAVQNAVHNQN